MRKLPSPGTQRTSATGSGLIAWARNVMRRYSATLSVPTGGAPPFHGVTYDASGVELDGAASDNDEAIRTSLIWFKHRWPGGAAEITGSEAFREKVWRIAQEVGTPLTASSRPSRTLPAVHRSAHR